MRINIIGISLMKGLRLLGNIDCKTLVDVRLKQARECLIASRANIDAGTFKASANRSYYAIFHAMRAVLALESFDSKKHSGVISTFRQRYIKTGKFDKTLSVIIKNAFDVRNLSDYDDFYIVSKAEVTEQLDNATKFLDAVINYIASYDGVNDSK